MTELSLKPSSIKPRRSPSNPSQPATPATREGLTKWGQSTSQGMMRPSVPVFLPLLNLHVRAARDRTAPASIASWSGSWLGNECRDRDEERFGCREKSGRRRYDGGRGGALGRPDHALHTRRAALRARGAAELRRRAAHATAAVLAGGRSAHLAQARVAADHGVS